MTLQNVDRLNAGKSTQDLPVFLSFFFFKWNIVDIQYQFQVYHIGIWQLHTLQIDHHKSSNIRRHRKLL